MAQASVMTAVFRRTPCHMIGAIEGDKNDICHYKGLVEESQNSKTAEDQILGTVITTHEDDCESYNNDEALYDV